MILSIYMNVHLAYYNIWISNMYAWYHISTFAYTYLNDTYDIYEIHTYICDMYLHASTFEYKSDIIVYTCPGTYISYTKKKK